MTPDLMAKIAKPLVESAGYKGGRDSLFTLLMAGGVWLATDVHRDSEETRKAVGRIEASQAQLEQRIAKLENHR